MGVKVRRLRSGKYYVVIDYHGRRKSKAIGTKEAADEVRRKVEARLALGDMSIFNEADNQTTATVESYGENWLEKTIRVKFKGTTHSTYRASLRTHVLPFLGKKRIVDLTESMIEDFVYQLTTQDDPPAQKTVSLALCVLRSMLTHAKKAKLISTNPAHGLTDLSRSGKLKVREGQAMTREESEKFLAAVTDLFPFMSAFFFTALRTGMRRGELCALKWGDIQFGLDESDPSRFILVQRNYVRGQYSTPKSGHGRRIDMSRQLRQLLIERRDAALLKAFGAGKSSVADDLVFPHENGGPLVADAIMRWYLEPALAHAGLRKFTIHDLRHTFATQLIQSGASLAYVQKQLGHSSISITVDTYGHLEPGANIAWADRLDTQPQQSANQTQTRENREMIDRMEDAESAMVSSQLAGMPLTVPPCICAPVRL